MNSNIKKIRVYLGAHYNKCIGSRHEVYVIGEWWRNTNTVYISEKALRRAESKYCHDGDYLQYVDAPGTVAVIDKDNRRRDLGKVMGFVFES